MVYILGTTRREYTLEGITLPKREYTEREIELGKTRVLRLTEDIYGKLSANKTFKELVASGEIQVRDSAPIEDETPAEVRAKYNNLRSDFDKAVADAKKATEDQLLAQAAKIDELSKQLEQFKADALKEIGDRDKKIEELEALLEKE